MYELVIITFELIVMELHYVIFPNDYYSCLSLHCISSATFVLFVMHLHYVLHLGRMYVYIECVCMCDMCVYICVRTCVYMRVCVH